MKTILLNDTSIYHSGSKQSVKILSSYYKPELLISTYSSLDLSLINNFDRIILNGEGTLHHNQYNAIKFLKYLREAQKLNKDTLIVNSVWQSMSMDWKDVLEKCSLIEVRETLSQNEIYSKYDIKPTVVLDISIHSDIEYEKIDSKEICVGGTFYGKINLNIENYTKIDVFSMCWPKLVNTIRSSKILITGRHHEMYAALQSRTPVIIISGNTWKNEGFFHTLKVPELIMPPTLDNIQDTINGKYNDSWQKVWNYLDNYDYKYR